VPPKTDIYEGVNPFEMPIYQAAEAAHYLRLPTATTRAWVFGRRYNTDAGERPFPPVIGAADREKRLLSFSNLVELHVLSSIRRVHEVKLQAIRKAVKYLQTRFASRHPLLEKEMLTDGKDLFIEQYGQLVAVSQDGQMAMKDILRIFLERIDRNDHGIPIRFFPVIGKRAEKSPRYITIDPTIRFGKPCIAGTRIPTAIIASRFDAGDSTGILAEDYGRSIEEIEEAVRYESRIAS
jgi:uncharacterized protein (DUF433 family)